MRHTKQWFRNRIGKRIYRKPLKCKCDSCQKDYVDIWDGVKNGKQELGRNFAADYIYMIQNELGIEYFDKPVGEPNA